jgi:MFS family permease
MRQFGLFVANATFDSFCFLISTSGMCTLLSMNKPIIQISANYFRNTFAALRYPNYRLWFMGQMASLVGTWFQTTAQGFLIFQLTHSAAYLGYVSFASGIPTWLLILYGGVINDRMPRRTLLVITQTSMMALAFILAALTFSNLMQPWHILALAFLLGIVNAFDAPARQAFVVELVDRADLTNAIALNSSMFQLAMVVGPALAGVTYAAFGAGWCFAINGITFVAVIAALLLMHMNSLPTKPRRASALHEVGEGLRYALKHSILRGLIALMTAVSLFTTVYFTLFPAWAVSVLHGSAATNGWLFSARGLGALLAALMIAALGRFDWKGRLLTLGTFLFPTMLIVFGKTTWLPLSLVVLLIVGLGFQIVATLAGTLVQTLVPEELRGRVTGIYSLVLFGSLPIGALAGGSAADWIGPQLTVILGAAFMLLFSAGLYIALPELRQVE